MRFIYLSTTAEKNLFGTMLATIDFFEEFYSNKSKVFNFNAGRGKIGKDSKNFDVGEDVLFLRAEHKMFTYKIVAYCKSASKVIANTNNTGLSHHFEIDSNTLKIFKKGIDIQYFDNFVFKKGYKTRDDFFTSNIDKNKGIYIGPSSWRYFSNETQIDDIMVFLKNVVFDESKLFD